MIVPPREEKNPHLKNSNFSAAQVCTDRDSKRPMRSSASGGRALIRLAQNSECLGLADWLGSIRDGSFFFRESDSDTRRCGGELELELELKLEHERVGGRWTKKPVVVDTKAEKPPLHILRHHPPPRPHLLELNKINSGRVFKKLSPCNRATLKGKSSSVATLKKGKGGGKTFENFHHHLVHLTLLTMTLIF